MSRNLLASVFVTYNRVVIKNADDDDNDDDDPRELGSDVTTVKIKDDDEEEMTPHRRQFERFGKSMCLCVAYAANVGGIGTLTGSPPNLVLKNQAEMCVL